VSVELFKHQQRWREMAPEHPRHFLNHEPGTGKTISVLAAVADNPIKTLVLAPLSILDAAWGRDARHFPALRTRIIRDARAIDGDWDVGITNYERFRPRADRFAAAGVRRLVLDEAPRWKNRKTRIAGAVHAFADRMESVWLLSGTPAPQDYSDWWSQLRCLSRGIRSYWTWCNEWGYEVKRPIRGKQQHVR